MTNQAFETCWVPSYTSFGVKRRPPEGFYVRTTAVVPGSAWGYEAGGRVLLSDDEMEGVRWERYMAIVERCLDAGHQWT